MSPLWWVAVALAGAAGAVCRYLVDFVISDRVSGLFPWGTFVVNVSGSLLFGVVAGAVGGVITEGAGLVLAVGFCGAYTTFSTHMVESLRLVEERRLTAAFGNVAGSLVAGMAAAALGFGLVS